MSLTQGSSKISVQLQALQGIAARIEQIESPSEQSISNKSLS
mgnify:CR=1 FL=1